VAGLGPREEVAHQVGAVVLAHEVCDPLAEAVLAHQAHALFDVPADESRALLRIETDVRVHARLVFDIERWGDSLADVVVERADTQGQRVGADGIGGGAGQDPDRDGVLEGAGGLGHQATEQRVLVADHFDQADPRAVPEGPFRHAAEGQRGQRGEYRAARAGQADAENGQRAAVAADQRDGRRRGRGDRARPGAGAQHAAASCAAGHEVGGQRAGQHRVHGVGQSRLGHETAGDSDQHGEAHRHVESDQQAREHRRGGDRKGQHDGQTRHGLAAGDDQVYQRHPEPECDRGGQEGGTDEEQIARRGLAAPARAERDQAHGHQKEQGQATGSREAPRVGCRQACLPQMLEDQVRFWRDRLSLADDQLVAAYGE
jgi:hypothetical protein